MELNAEINKVFGQEMAKLFVASLDEEEMKKKATQIWQDITRKEYKWGVYSDSELETYIKRDFLQDIQTKIKEILNEPQNADFVEKRAREMVAEARRIGEEAIIKAMAEHMVENTLSAYNNNDAFVSKVMGALHVSKEGLYR